MFKSYSYYTLTARWLRVPSWEKRTDVHIAINNWLMIRQSCDFTVLLPWCVTVGPLKRFNWGLLPACRLDYWLRAYEVLVPCDRLAVRLQSLPIAHQAGLILFQKTPWKFNFYIVPLPSHQHCNGPIVHLYGPIILLCHIHLPFWQILPNHPNYL